MVSIDRSLGINVSMTLSIRHFYVSLHVVYVDYDVLLCESKLSESIVFVIGMEGMAPVCRNVHSLNSSLCRQWRHQEAAIFIRRLGCLSVEKMCE